MSTRAVREATPRGPVCNTPCWKQPRVCRWWDQRLVGCSDDMLLCRSLNQAQQNGRVSQMKTPRRNQPQSMCDGFRVQQIQKQTKVSAVIGSLVDWQLPFGGPWCLWGAGETLFHRLYRSLQSKTCQAVSSWCICAFVRMYTVQHLKKYIFSFIWLHHLLVEACRIFISACGIVVP